MSYFEYKDNFSEISQISVITVFENCCPQTPKATIAIPTFNRVTTLEVAIESAINQDYDNYNIIVVDNNPERDNDTEIFMKRYKNNPIVSYYKNTENIGLFGNWNRCFELATGEWVSLLHDDDYYFPNYLSTLLRYIDSFPNIEGMYCHHVNWTETPNGKITDINPSKIRKRGITKVKNYMLFVTHDVGPIGIMFKRTNVISLGGYNADLYPIADYAFNWKYQVNYGLFYLDTTLVHYRIGINVSIKPETIELQEEKCLDIRQEYVRGKKFKYFLDRFSFNTYCNNLALAQTKCPNYLWKTTFRFSRNVYYWVWRSLLIWNYLRICIKSKKVA